MVKTCSFSERSTWRCCSASSLHTSFHTARRRAPAVRAHQEAGQPPEEQPGVCTRRHVAASLALVSSGSSALWPCPSRAAGVGAAPTTATSAAGAEAHDRGELRGRLEQRVQEFTLNNGLHFIVLPRSAAPIISCHTHCSVGAFVEEEGQTGIAHLLEHMAFKGSARLGSRDWRREASVLDELDSAFYELRDAGAGGVAQQRLEVLQQRFEELKATADALLVPNAFGARLSSEGASGLNASTSHDCTRYYCSLPANKLELWLALEAERFRAPVFRQLYTEKVVVAEERRARQDNSPVGAWSAAFNEAALGNAYRRPVIGYAPDVDAMGRREVAHFFTRYYHPANLTISIVGDVDPEAVQKLAEKYFGGWVAPPGAIVVRNSREALSLEPLPLPQPRPAAEFRRPSAAGPALLLGYYRPSMVSPKGTALEVASDVLSGGRGSRLVRRLVQGQRLLSASTIVAYPGELHAGLTVVQAVPRPGDSLEAAAQLLQQQLNDLCASGPSAAELERVKRASRVSLLSGLQSNVGMAATLAGYHASTGSWRGLLQEVEQVDALTAEEVRAAAAGVFGAANRFSGFVLPPGPAGWGARAS